jgi:carboxymethylenebutenolidase
VSNQKNVEYVAYEQVWQAHTDGEFVDKDVDATMRTMTESPHVLHVSTAVGARGRDAVRAFYAEYFVGRVPDDFHLELLSRTIGADRLVDEMLVSFTHDSEVPWILPGVAPTGRRVEIATVAIIGIRNDLIDSEHIYWDQASVLAQVGLLDPAGLPVLGAGQARCLLDGAPLNTLLGVASPRTGEAGAHGGSGTGHDDETDSRQLPRCESLVQDDEARHRTDRRLQAHQHAERPGGELAQGHDLQGPRQGGTQQGDGRTEQEVVWLDQGRAGGCDPNRCDRDPRDGESEGEAGSAGEPPARLCSEQDVPRPAHSGADREDHPDRLQPLEAALGEQEDTNAGQHHPQEVADPP